MSFLKKSWIKFKMLFKQGITPKQLALSITVATIVSLFPIFGISTIVLAALGALSNSIFIAFIFSFCLSTNAQEIEKSIFITANAWDTKNTEVLSQIAKDAEATLNPMLLVLENADLQLTRLITLSTNKKSKGIIGIGIGNNGGGGLIAARRLAAWGMRIEMESDLQSAKQELFKQQGPAILEIITDTSLI